ncbi:STAS-like domain-containing protein [Flavobacterium sp. FlaQc-28]|uniref:STAS-like domain-containing protein n=1 Tax=Flavobacterium sp. FlaQc-28 TaxID=3374178 RepID=UPI003756F068
MKEIEYKVLDFTEYPGPRYKDQGQYSGEYFYENVIKPKFQEALESNSILVLDLDNTAGYASSFLDECFGNLVYDFNYDEIFKRLKIISTQEPDWIEVIFKETLPEWKRKRDGNIDRKSPAK